MPCGVFIFYNLYPIPHSEKAMRAFITLSLLNLRAAPQEKKLGNHFVKKWFAGKHYYLFKKVTMVISQATKQSMAYIRHLKHVMWSESSHCDNNSIRSNPHASCTQTFCMGLASRANYPDRQRYGMNQKTKL